MSRAHSRLVPVDGRLLDELLTVLDEAFAEGNRRALGRLAAREGLAADDAVEEVGAFPRGACSALEPGFGLRPSLCTAGRGCPVEEECPFVRGEGPARIPQAATAQLFRELTGRWRRSLPPAPVAGLGALVRPLSRLLERSGRVDADSPPRARTSLALIEMAVRRGGPLGAVTALLTAGELEQVAAFVPPGAGRGDPPLHEVEMWLRQATLAEAGLVEVS
jgi:hypothetical protein